MARVSRTRRSLRSLEMFDAVARHLSISKAAHELGVTQSAVSHQMSYLSQQTGEKLFIVTGRKLALTPAGEKLAHRMREIFTEIDVTISEIVGSNRNTVRLAICSSFALGWLSKRIAQCYAENPDIELQLIMSSEHPELKDAIADIFVTTEPKAPGFSSYFLLREYLMPVCAPDAAGRLPLITTTLDATKVGDDWISYCKTANRDLSMFHTGRWLQVSHHVIAHDMARHGAGVALVPSFLVEDSIKVGALKQIGPEIQTAHDGYHLCVKTSRRNENSLRKLVHWFQSSLNENKDDILVDEA